MPSTPRPEVTAKANFDEFTQQHELTILHDDGLYRHIRMAAPGTRMWSWDLVTVPGHLFFTGDIGDYTFSRLTDMFEFFSIPEGRRIDYHYWAEKIQNHDARQGTRVFSPEKAKHAAVEAFWEMRVYHDHALDAWRDLRDSVLDPYVLGDRSVFYDAAFTWRHGSMEFHDIPDWDLDGWDTQFVTACHAIAAGVRAYNAAKQVAA